VNGFVSLMTFVAERTLATSSDQSDTGAAPLALIDLDRFCNHCGYNLRTLPVYRDVRTGIPIVRCTECGRYQAANDGATALRPWLNRLTALILWAWILAVISGVFLIACGEGGISYATLDELTVHGGYTTQQVGPTTVRTWASIGPLQIDTDYKNYRVFITTILITSFAIAFGGGLYLVVVFPHWPRLAYVGGVLAVPLVIGLIVAVSWSQQAPHLFAWGVPYIVAHAAAQILGGIVGVCFGRPAARLMVRLVLPSSLRPRLAYLWLADDKPFPKA
jgi:hypothetical protein